MNDAEDWDKIPHKGAKVPMPIAARLKALYSKEYNANELQYLHCQLMAYRPMENGQNFSVGKSAKNARNTLVGEHKFSALEKVQFIIAAGLQRPNLRCHN
jgi:hypothetical protein